MPKYEITAPDGRKFEITAPEGASQDDVMRYAREQWSAQRQPTLTDKAESVGRSALAGLMDPLLGISQLVSRNGAALSSLGGKYTKPVTEFLEREAALYDGQIKDMDREANAARQRAGFEGIDLTRIGASIVNPVNAIPAAGLLGKAKTVGTVANLAARGAAMGGVSAAMQPVLNSDSYLTEKLSQIGFGAAAGGALTPAVGKLAEAIGRRVNQLAHVVKRPRADEVIDAAFAEAGLRRADYSKTQMDALRAEIESSLKVGKLVNPAAVARKADFDALGMKGTSGQITRDPTQYTQELNLSKVGGVGDKLQGRFNEQSRRLSELMDKYGAGADEPVVAGQKVMTRLKNVDDQMRQRVSGLYKQAGESAGVKDTVPTTGLAQDVMNVLDDFRERVPGGVAARIKSYGFVDGKQTKVFDIEEAESLLKLINSHMGPTTDPATSAALGRLSQSVKKSIVEAAQDGGPFAVPRQAAKARFDIHDAVPALEKVARGAANPDDFIDKFIVRAPAGEVKGLSQLLDENSRTAIRKIIGDQLRRAAYGVDAAGDARFSQARYNETLRKIGDSRLKAFFDNQELAELKRIGRVAAFKESRPANSAVNEANTASALYNLARATGSGLFDQPVLNFLPSVADAASKSNLVSYALKDGVDPMIPALGQAGVNRARLLSGAVPLAGGVLLGSPVSQ